MLRSFCGFVFPAQSLRNNETVFIANIKGTEPNRAIAMSVTNDECQISALYLANGGCGHAGEQRVTKGRPFPTCRVCGKAVHWTFLRETYSPNSYGDSESEKSIVPALSSAETEKVGRHPGKEVIVFRIRTEHTQIVI